MRSLPRQDIETALKTKGFVLSAQDRDHRFYYFHYQNKKTAVRTKISTGSKYRDYDVTLLKLMKNQLNLDRLGDLEDLVKCPLTKSLYEAILLKKQIIS